MLNNRPLNFSGATRHGKRECETSQTESILSVGIFVLASLVLLPLILGCCCCLKKFFCPRTIVYMGQPNYNMERSVGRRRKSKVQMDGRVKRKIERLYLQQQRTVDSRLPVQSEPIQYSFSVESLLQGNTLVPIQIPRTRSNFGPVGIGTHTYRLQGRQVSKSASASTSTFPNSSGASHGSQPLIKAPPLGLSKSTLTDVGESSLVIPTRFYYDHESPPKPERGHNYNANTNDYLGCAKSNDERKSLSQNIICKFDNPYCEAMQTVLVKEAQQSSVDKRLKKDLTEMRVLNTITE